MAEEKDAGTQRKRKLAIPDTFENVIKALVQPVKEKKRSQSA